MQKPFLPVPSIFCLKIMSFDVSEKKIVLSWASKSIPTKEEGFPVIGTMTSSWVERVKGMPRTATSDEKIDLYSPSTEGQLVLWDRQKLQDFTACCCVLLVLTACRSVLLVSTASCSLLLVLTASCSILLVLTACRCVLLVLTACHCVLLVSTASCSVLLVLTACCCALLVFTA